MLWTNFGIWSLHLGCTFKKGPLIEIEYIMKWIVTWFECLEMDALKERFKVLEGVKRTFQWINVWYNLALFISLSWSIRGRSMNSHCKKKKENPSCTPTYVILGNLILVYNISFFMLLQFQISTTQLPLTAIRIWNAKIKENLHSQMKSFAADNPALLTWHLE